MNNKNDYIEAAHQIIIALGLPRAQQNERSALALLALLNLTPGKVWAEAENPLMGITPIMDWVREQNRIPVEIAPGKKITLSPGEHSELIRAIIEDFAPRFAPGSVLVYAGDTGDKWGYFDAPLLAGLGVHVDSHGKMPDVVLHYTAKNWLLLVESVTSHGPVDGKRHAELATLFAGSTAGLVYVTAFPNRAIMGRHLAEIAWETEVWVADAPSHLIHFNGARFLGPHDAP
jgi:hypothetical protein